MSAINSMHQANAQALAQSQKLTEVAAAGQQALTNQAVKVAKLAAEQQIQSVQQATTDAALDTVV